MLRVSLYSAESSDFDLAVGLRAKQPEALAVIYDRYSRPAYSLLWRITGDRGSAEDLLQELFLRVWNRAGGFDDSRGELKTWILSVARNMGIDYLRSSQSRLAARFRPLDFIDSLDHSVQRGKTYLGMTVIENQSLIRAAFQCLPREQQQVLEMAYFEGSSHTEIAATFDKPLGTVKTWVRLGLLAMRSAMANPA